jgi:DNA-directed RNA polymerase subunit M/transcription elongation factor TFIIS
MDKPARRTCPACGDGDYTFRSRRQVVKKPGEPDEVETKFRCKSCGEEWRVAL